jgi:hypothetical protein
VFFKRLVQLIDEHIYQYIPLFKDWQAVTGLCAGPSQQENPRRALCGGKRPSNGGAA